MFADSHTWMYLLVDVSIKALLLALITVLGMVILRVRNNHVRHRVWMAVLASMLSMPLLVQVVPGLAIPVPGLAFPESETTGLSQQAENDAE